MKQAANHEETQELTSYSVRGKKPAIQVYYTCTSRRSGLETRGAWRSRGWT
jgi:hypothetical protein